MADNVGNGDSATTSSVRCPRNYFAHRRRKIKRGRVPRDDIDLISSLPDEILQVIISFISTKLAITTSVLSKRWRHILTLDGCNLKDKSFAKIISGSPLLETLRLYHCDELHHLDLSKSPRLKTLEIDSKVWLKGTRIDAPHLHYLRLRLTDSMFPYTLVDVSSLTEAEIHTDASSDPIKIVDHCLQTLEKLQNVEKLTFGERFLKILSRAELLGYPSPKFKAKVLTLNKTTISQYVISGVVRLLQHSPELKKLTLRTMDCDAIRGYVDNYLDSYTWIPYQCSESWVFGDVKSRDVETEHVALFMELVLKTTKTLEKMVIRLGPYRSERGVEELRQMVPMLSHDNDVSIVLIATKRWIRESSKW
ncbi:PREDICTED: F-box/LRR-repeat protein At3g03360-like [Camelina sativa]|uniref:F-box/LRR-repeat protein At3g03360-like n=1 Tax=Camelina sativa TaxID=90675 RepID=A0ABM0SLF7_CAMSA|nr:PREDICTED: F-box/LRR-repeat protein At3g03360-like [Camelina sativa]